MSGIAEQIMNRLNALEGQNVAVRVKQLEDTISEMNRINNATTAEVQHLRDLLNTMGQPRDNKRRMVESKHMMPEKFGTEKNPSWRSWRREVVEFVQNHDDALAKALLATETGPNPVLTTDLPVLNPFDDSQLRALLANRCVKGSAAGNLVDNFANSTGLELWRNLSGYFNPLVEFRKVEQTMSVMNPGRAKDLTRLGEMIPAWENLYEENKRRTGDMIPDTWKTGTLYRMMPQSLENELIKDHFKWDTYEKLKAHVYLMIHSRTTGHSPMLHNLEDEPSGALNEEMEVHDEDGEIYLLGRSSDGKQTIRRKGKRKGPRW
jgi:hypothetical protein